METCTGITANPDIAGIGVRLSIYIQSFLTQIPPVLAIVLSRGEYCSEPERLASMQTSRYAVLAVGFGLLISAVVQAVAYQLTVYHALVTLNLSWIIAITACSSWCFFWMIEADEYNLRQGSHNGLSKVGGAIIKSVAVTALPGLKFNHPRYAIKREPIKSASWGITCFVHVTFLSALGIWLFSDMTHFDSRTPECTSVTIYPVFGHQVELTSHRLRTFWLAIYGIGVTPGVNVILFFLFKIPFLFLFIAVSPLIEKPLKALGKRYKPALRLYVAFEEGYYAFYFSDISVTIIFICLAISSTEDMVSRNRVLPGENQWTFGQTLSLFLVVPGIFAVFQDIQMTRKRWKEHVQASDMELFPLEGSKQTRPQARGHPQKTLLLDSATGSTPSGPGNPRRRRISV